MSSTPPADDDGLLDFIRSLHKAEIHSHLSGSVRDATLLELREASNPTTGPLLQPFDASARTLAECFQVFDMIHKTITTAAHLRRVVCEMVEDNASDGVVYLEIRTTPRALLDFEHAEGTATTRVVSIKGGQEDLDVDAALHNYVQTVLEAVESSPAVRSGVIHVRLLLSINRTSTLATMERIVHVALASPAVVGLDVSGDPTRGDMLPILALLEQRARPAGLFVSIHAGEVMNVKETEAILSYRPERLGHCCVLSESTRSRMLKLVPPIPLELCPTSNCLTLHLPTFDFHPEARFWIENNYPIAICTDDSGVFNVTLSKELHLVAVTRGLSRAQVADLALASFDFLFCDTALRDSLKAAARAEADRLLLLGPHH